MRKKTAVFLILALCLTLTVPALAAGGDFVIEDGVLTKYRGSDDNVVIPDGVTGITLNAFSGKMTGITIPDSVTSIEEGAFRRCLKLTAIHVDAGNPAYTDVDGVLLSRDGTLLHTYPASRLSDTYTVPKGVTRIGNEAFEFCENLTEITIPAGVTSIGDEAFEHCKNLTHVTVPDSVTSIGYCAFWETPWQEGLGEFPIVNGILLDYQGSGGDLVIPEGVTEIGDAVFWNFDEVTGLTLPDTLTSIGWDAFYECNSLTEVTIPAGVAFIGERAFSGCDKLTAIHVAPGNPNYCDVDGVLYSRDMTLLHTYPAGKPAGPYTVPKGVTRIAESAFDDCKTLNSVTIPDGVTVIGGGAFIACENLTEVTIPDSVTVIGWNAFYDCHSLTDVYYGGSEEQWEAMEIGHFNAPLTGAAIHYNSPPAPTPEPSPTPVIPTPAGPPAATPVPVRRFTDVTDTDYFAQSVQWAVGKNITAGTTDTTFSPHDTCTTAQILSFLWRAKGQPNPTGSNPFSDVITGDYYYKAALWAYEKGLVSGDSFNGGSPCTRAQTVTYLWKLAGSPAAPGTSFTDVSASADYAKAVAWAVQKGVTAGTSDTTFSPDDTCTRAQIVTFLYRDLA